MSEPLTISEPIVYQLRVVLRGVSPLIWRRLLVRSNSTIAGLHATLQIALGWSDEHLNRFVIHGREYGVSHLGGISFRDDPCQVRLADLGLRVRERFLYEYDLTDGWQHDVRLEQFLPVEQHRSYPRCIAGRRNVPPEDCGGPWALLELRQRHSLLAIADRLYDLAKRSSARRGEAFMHDHSEDVLRLLHWLDQSFRSSISQSTPGRAWDSTRGEGGMRVRVQVIVENDGDTPSTVHEVACVERGDLGIDTLGLHLAEAKDLLQQVQGVVIAEQAQQVLAEQVGCPACGRARRHKDAATIVLRTLVFVPQAFHSQPQLDFRTDINPSGGAVSLGVCSSGCASLTEATRQLLVQTRPSRVATPRIGLRTPSQASDPQPAR
jgi:hypothetical protein